MRFRLPSLAFVALALPLAGMAILSACGSSTDDSLTDAGKDATTTDVAQDVVVDVAPEAANDAGGCMNDADLTMFLPSGDAGVDADAGGLNLGICIGCFETKCGTQITACNGDCACRQSIIDLVTCVGMTGDFMTCGETAILNGDNQVSALLGCAYTNCISACTPGGGDGGTIKDAAGDGG